MALYPITRSLPAPISVPNISKGEIVSLDDKRDVAGDPRFIIEMHFQGAGGRDAGTHSLIARDVSNSNPLLLKTHPTSYTDIISSGGIKQIDGACTSLATAYDAACDATVGNRTAKKTAAALAAYAKAVEIGLVDPELALT